MTKIPFVAEYHQFTRSEYKHAEEVLAEYNDFYIFNMAQVANVYHVAGDDETDDEEVDLIKRQEDADENAKAATEHFKALFGSKDFGESSMIGFRPAWYDLQKILFDEYKKKTPIEESQMNVIANNLRRVASVLLFGERIVRGLEDLCADPLKIQSVKEGFEKLLEAVTKGSITIPEFNKEKKNISKFKKPEQFIDFANRICG